MWRESASDLDWACALFDAAEPLGTANSGSAASNIDSCTNSCHESELALRHFANGSTLRLTPPNDS